MHLSLGFYFISTIGGTVSFHIVKAVLLCGEDDATCLVASSVYDTKPVHYLTMVSSKIEWVELKKIIYNADIGRVELMSFLQLYFIHKHNNTMDDVDVADQL